MPSNADNSLTIVIPYPDRDLSPNGRKHRFAVSAKRKAAKEFAFYATRAALFRDHSWRDPDNIPDRLLMTISATVAVVRGRDDDNLIASLKAARDGLALALRIDDKRIATGDVTFEVKRGATPEVALILTPKQERQK